MATYLLFNHFRVQMVHGVYGAHGIHWSSSVQQHPQGQLDPRVYNYGISDRLRYQQFCDPWSFTWCVAPQGYSKQIQPFDFRRKVTYKDSTLDMEGRLKYSEKPESIDHKMLDSQTSCSITGEALLSRGAGMCFQKVHFSPSNFAPPAFFPVHLSDSTSQNKLFLHLPIINSRPQLWPIDKIIKACKVFLSANWILF